jgi:hypothetical protein
MQLRDYRDVMSGAALLVLGCLITIYSLFNYPLGSVTQMGPGMFPVVLGGILGFLGCLIGIPAWFRSGEMPEIALRQLVIVLLSIGAFAILLEPFGVVPAVTVLTVGAVLADDEVSVKGALLLVVIMALTTVLLFQKLLGVPFQAFSWPL